MTVKGLSNSIRIIADETVEPHKVEGGPNSLGGGMNS